MAVTSAAAGGPGRRRLEWMSSRGLARFLIASAPSLYVIAVLFIGYFGIDTLERILHVQ